MPKPCKLPVRFLWAHKEVDLVPHPVVTLVLQAGYAEKFPQAFGFESLNPFLRVSKQGLYLTAIEEDGGNKTPVQFELACKADGVASPGPV